MWCKTVFWHLVWFAVAIPAAAAADAPLPEIVKTSQREFCVPFDLDLDTAGPQPREVQLHVSEDRGQTWKLCSTVKPDRHSFQFIAPQEGEYWFAVRTVDPHGKCWPDVLERPEMRVVVEPLDPVEPVEAGFPTDRMPPGVKARMVNSTAFELDYDVQSLGSSTATKVELWWSGDGGRNWRRFGVDDDNLSPMLVHVDRDGLFGFWMVIETDAGLRGAAPQPGDLPQIWVGVDTIKPTARLLTAEISGTDEGNEITIRWNAADALLAACPISVFYSATPEGPWAPLANEIENRGTYTCRLTEGIPRQLYLRLEVRDEARNVQQVQPAEPVQVVHGRGRELPAGRSARSFRSYQVFR
jgi:hypothetical protein